MVRTFGYRAAAGDIYSKCILVLCEGGGDRLIAVHCYTVRIDTACKITAP
ncbi:hypothetical protein ES708_27460 [subsurface metagenome]